MKRSQANRTTAANLEEKFDQGGEVLDYFEVRKARVILPPAKQSVAKQKFAYKRGVSGRAAVGETAPPYRKKR